MSDIENLLNKLGGEFRFDTGHVLLNLIQYSIRNRKFLELILRNQMEIRENLQNPGSTSPEEMEQQFEDALEEIQQDVEKEYYDLLSFLTSRSNPEKD